jgi:hypothetical protein
MNTPVQLLESCFWNLEWIVALLAPLILMVLPLNSHNRR